MTKLYYPIVGPINHLKVEKLKKIFNFINGPDDQIISYIASSGGEANSASTIISAISSLSIKTIAFSGSIVYSSAAIIYSSFEERISFEDSKFLIHPCIPPIGVKRTEIYDQFDLQIWEFMVKRMKISLSDLIIIAQKGNRMTAQEALEIGLVNKIRKGSYKNIRKSLMP